MSSQLSKWLRCWIPNVVSRIQIYWLVSRSKSFQPFIKSKLIKWLPGTSRDWVVNSKLFHCSGSVALTQLNSIHKKQLESFKFSYMIISFFYSLHSTEAYLEPSQTFMMELFRKNSKQLFIFVQMLHHRLNWVLDMPQYISQSLFRIRLYIHDGTFFCKNN